MAMNTCDHQFLLIQYRHTNRIAELEAQNFIDFCGINANQLHRFNTFKNDRLKPPRVDQYDAIIIGGSSGDDVSVTQVFRPYYITQSLELIQHCIHIKKPVVASCYGFQLTVLALGGHVVRDTQNFEKGTPLIHLTPSAKDDPLFQTLPDPFAAVAVHQDKALTLSPGCQALAYNHHCVHALNVDHAPFWAVQFHPENDTPSFKERITHFKELYCKTENEFQTMINNCKETPDSNRLLQTFTQYVLNSKAVRSYNY